MLLIVSCGWNIQSATGQTTTTNRIELDNRDTTESQIETLKKDFTEAIVHGAPESLILRLIDRRRQVDNDLSGQLDRTHRQLAERQRDGDPVENAEAIASLRRERSLIWLRRIELSAMQSECFLAGSPDAVVAAHETVRLIQAASTELPSRPSEIDGRQRPGDLVAGELNRLLIDAHLQAGEGWAAQQVWSSQKDASAPSTAPEKLVMSVRIDLANRRYEEAERSLRAFYGADPVNAANSTAMDLAMLEFLWSSPLRDAAKLGNWLDTIEIRGGPFARRRAETWVARQRQLSEKPSQVTSDPRLMRADGRYYYRTEKLLQAAIAFAKASVQDDRADRAIDSAVSSAAILQKLTKPDAGKELLLQVAGRFSDRPQSADLVLQAASLASQSVTANDDEVETILRQCLLSWPQSDASRSARDWLIEILSRKGDLLEAARFATTVPIDHANETTPIRSRELWSRAVLAADDYREALSVMRGTLGGLDESNEQFDTEQLRLCLLALLGDTIPESNKIIDPIFRRLAEFRTTPEVTTFGDLWDRIEQNSNLKAAVRWRLQRDIEQRPETASVIASVLLQHDGGTERDRLRWMVQNGQTDRALDFMRTQMRASTDPGQWLRFMASTLSTTPRSHPQWLAHLKLASRLWTELAEGLPSDAPGGIEAQVEAIRCQFQSGDRAAAIAKAELMLLTNPPEDPELRTWLNGLSE
ncbi:hypothetical protein [Neorhodopirellula pilleata]|uniref:hypothetical protein n=1 Tax=Neorhodopirellula pilleata TaxID=2714738 RepID=UPI0011B50448|nr:hypothetical protein [Neorhodopirellula pilleata]